MHVNANNKIGGGETAADAKGGRTMASAEPEPITGVRRRSPQQGPGAELLVGLRGKLPEAERFLSTFIQKRDQKLRI